MSAGLDPELSTLFIQSAIKEHAELFLLLAMIAPLPWLERVPTYKEQQQQLDTKDLATYGFLGYPVLQAADIIIYRANGVPVGKDQLPHVELTREIARRFNFMYRTEIFPIPDPLLTEVPVLPGLDGRKMSKSYGNCIFITDSVASITEKIAGMMTDPQRKHRKDPGDPEVCPVFAYHKLYSSPAEIGEVAVGCRTAGIGCVDCKKNSYAQRDRKAQTASRKTGRARKGYGQGQGDHQRGKPQGPAGGRPHHERRAQSGGVVNGGRKSEIGIRKSEVGNRKAEERKQKTENGRSKPAVRSPLYGLRPPIPFLRLPLPGLHPPTSALRLPSAFRKCSRKRALLRGAPQRS